MPKRKTSQKSPAEGSTKPIDRVAARSLGTSALGRPTLKIPDGNNAIKEAINWALKGIEDANSMLCLCPEAKKVIRAFIKFKKERYPPPEELAEREKQLYQEISALSLKRAKKEIRGKRVTYWTTVIPRPLEERIRKSNTRH